MSDTDLTVSFPAQGVIRLSSQALFGDTDSPTCRRFLERVSRAEEISDVTITMGDFPFVELRYSPVTWTLRDVVNRISSFLRQAPEANDTPASTTIQQENVEVRLPLGPAPGCDSDHGNNAPAGDQAAQSLAQIG
jgi:hypothetical protein